MFYSIQLFYSTNGLINKKKKNLNCLDSTISFKYVFNVQFNLVSIVKIVTI